MSAWVLAFTLVVSGKLPTVIEHQQDISGTFYGTKKECEKVAHTLWQNLTWIQDGQRMALTRIAKCVQPKRKTS